MLNLIFTLDYEIQGSGEGSPHELMVEPTRRMMRSFERFGAKLTIMADVAEIAQFRQYSESHGEDRFHSKAIEDQLREAAGRGHDVQLHIHSSYYGARYENGRWVQDWTQYDLARLGYERLAGMIGEGKAYLESLLRPVAPDYACLAFRAANWSMQPSGDIVRALRDNGILFDTSVFKYGSRSGRLVHFDYTHAFSDLVPWPVDETDLCLADPNGALWEVPICCENSWLWRFLSVSRFHRIRESRIPALGKTPRGGGGQGADVSPGERRDGCAGRRLRKLASLLRKNPLKMDFNKCSGRQLIRALKRIDAKYGDFPHPLPVVLIGHSKLYTRYNEKNLAVFLEHVARHAGRYRFATFRELEPSEMRKAFEHEWAGRARRTCPRSMHDL